MNPIILGTNAAMPLLKGILVGSGIFAYSILAQKVCMLAGVKFEEAIDPEEPYVPPSERFDTVFKDMVVRGPILEEAIFRGALQPALSYALALYIPYLATHSLLGLPFSQFIAAITVGVGFSAIHYPDFEKGGATWCAVIGAVGGSAFGLTYTYWGLSTSIAAHMTANLMVAVLDKHFPKFLESEKEKALRLSKIS